MCAEDAVRIRLGPRKSFNHNLGLVIYRLTKKAQRGMG